MLRIFPWLAVFLVCLSAPVKALEIQEITTDIGLEALLVEDHALPIITLSFSFEGGATQDPEGKSGALSLMSSLLDEGAGPYDAVAFQDRMEDLAMRMSFGAGRDYLNGSLRTLTGNADDAFEMLRLALYEPRFDEKPLNRIRDQILSGIRSSQNNPGSIVGKTLREMIYPDRHPYRRTSRGTLESVTSLTVDDLRALKRRVLGRDRLIISAVGDITPQDLKRRLDALFGGLPEKADLVPVEQAELIIGETRLIKMDRPQTSFTLIGKGIARQDPDYFAAYLVNQILGGSGLTSRLSNEVREKRGLAYSISTGLANHKAASLFTGSVATRADFADQTLDVMISELKRMADEGPTEEELALAKSYTIGVYALNFDGSSDIARTLTSLQSAGLPADYIKTRAATINAVTLEETKAVAKRLFGKGHYTLLRFGPVAKAVLKPALKKE